MPRKRTRRPRPTREERLRALATESEAALDDLIRRLLALPVSRRTHFLRARLPGGGSGL
jgi:hypothetical protein